MRKAVLAIFAAAIFARGQSVSQTLATLTNKVASLEARPAGSGGTGSPWVRIATGASGGTLGIQNAKGKYVGSLASADGGDSGVLNLWNGSTSTKPQVSLGMGNQGKTGGLALADSTGDKQLAYFGANTGGTAGTVWLNGATVHDYAEVFDIADCHGLKPGSVVAESADGKGIQLAGQAYDSAAVGVLSGAGAFQPGMRIGSREDGTSDLPVAVSGQVYVRVNREAGPIKVGDLLVSSSVPGVAMRAADASRLTGTVIGKALQPSPAPETGEAESLIRMLVLNR